MRHAVIGITYAGVNISKAIQGDLLSFEYAEVAEGNADSLMVTVQNKSLKWMGAWLPLAGDRMKASLTSYDWNSKGEILQLECGVMEVDEPEFSGPPDIITLKALNIPVLAGFNDTPNDKTWNKTSMKQLGAFIAKKYSMTFLYDTPNDFIITALKQSSQTDADLLATTAQTYNLCLKVYSNRIVIYSKYVYEQRAPILTITRGKSNISAYTFATSIVNTGYSAVTVKYTSTKTKKILQYEFRIAQGGKSFSVQEAVDNIAQAELVAKANLRTMNEGQNTGTFTLSLNLKLVAGCTIMVVGYGKFDGKWFVDNCNHVYGGTVGTTDITIHKCLKGGY